MAEADETCAWHPTPNFGDRRGGVQPDMVVLHYTAMVDAVTALDRLCDPTVEVSAHYLIGRDGKCWQLVDERKRAWHAGSGCWGGRADVNSHSIGIELDNDGASPFGELLMARLERLLPAILRRWKIPRERVIGHSDMAPGRKIDPGRRFDWQRLARQGLACWPMASAADEGAHAPEKAAPLGARDDSAFREIVGRLGYPTDGPLDDLLEAFRSRFAQQAHGPLSPEDIALARHLAHRFPVDPALRAT